MPLPSHRTRKFRIAAVTIGIAAGLLLVSASRLFIGLTAPSWDAPLQVTHMDCEHGICRDHPNARRTIQDATGALFEVIANAEGFRGADPPPPGEGLVVQIYGDSMIHGTGVQQDETIAVQLQTRLRAALGTDAVRVVNYGMPMTYLVSSLRIYEVWGRPGEPDVTIFQFNGGVPRPRDVHTLVQQIRSSWWMSRVFQTDLGRAMVNRVQRAWVENYRETEAIEVLRPGMELLQRDQTERGFDVVFFSFTSTYDDLDRVVAPDLRYEKVTTSLSTWEEYQRSPYIIPGDGHPNATGTAHFADAIAETVLPLLRARLAAEAATTP